jgi:mono/diheme cytochrome c family protein
MKILKVLVVLLVTVAISAAAFVWLGIYNIAADDPHWDSTYRVLETVRDRSIRSRAGAVVVPALDDAALIRSGAGNYSSMCVDCHLSPGAAETELSLGLYPTPPAWSALAKTDPRDAFWVIKHGIKMSGMPAWGKSMDDKYIWGMVAFMGQFPGMSAERYRELVASSGGHSHGGGETMMDQDGSMQGSEHSDGHGHDEGARSSFEPVDDPMAGAKPNPKPEGDHEHQH